MVKPGDSTNHYEEKKWRAEVLSLLSTLSRAVADTLSMPDKTTGQTVLAVCIQCIGIALLAGVYAHKYRILDIHTHTHQYTHSYRPGLQLHYVGTKLSAFFFVLNHFLV